MHYLRHQPKEGYRCCSKKRVRPSVWISQHHCHGSALLSCLHSGVVDVPLDETVFPPALRATRESLKAEHLATVRNRKAPSALLATTKCDTRALDFRADDLAWHQLRVRECLTGKCSSKAEHLSDAPMSGKGTNLAKERRCPPFYTCKKKKKQACFRPPDLNLTTTPWDSFAWLFDAVGLPHRCQLGAHVVRGIFHKVQSLAYEPCATYR